MSPADLRKEGSAYDLTLAMGILVATGQIKEKIPLENLLVVTDDLNLDFGTFRIKTKGSDGGHNGLKDAQQVLNTSKYNRFRFGIGDTFSQGKQVDYVLGEWIGEEQKLLPERIEKATEIIKSFGLAGITNTMNSFNGK